MQAPHQLAAPQAGGVVPHQIVARQAGAVAEEVARGNVQGGVVIGQPERGPRLAYGGIEVEAAFLRQQTNGGRAQGLRARGNAEERVRRNGLAGAHVALAKTLREHHAVVGNHRDGQPRHVPGFPQALNIGLQIFEGIFR